MAADTVLNPFRPAAGNAPEPVPAAVRDEPMTVTGAAARASVYGMAWILLNGADPIAARVFLDRVLDGAGLPQGHPVLAFRARIWNSVENQERLSETEQLALIVLAWNAWREDRELSRMQLPKGGLTPKNFPEPK